MREVYRVVLLRGCRTHPWCLTQRKRVLLWKHGFLWNSKEERGRRRQTAMAVRTAWHRLHRLGSVKPKPALGRGGVCLWGYEYRVQGSILDCSFLTSLCIWTAHYKCKYMHRAHVILYVSRGMLNHILYTYENNVTIHKDSEISSTWIVRWAESMFFLNS